MEENKKRPLSEEELEQVAGGVQHVSYSNGVSGWKCSYCSELFSTYEEAEAHQEICPVRISALNSNDSNTSSGGGVHKRLLKPIIL